MGRPKLENALTSVLATKVSKEVRNKFIAKATHEGKSVSQLLQTMILEKVNEKQN